jgi:hypothetical protein
MKYILLVFFIMIYSSCLTSLHPITTLENIMREDRVLGTWQNDDGIFRVERFTESELYGFLLLPEHSRKARFGEKPAGENPDTLYSKGYNIKFQKNGVNYHMFGTVTKISGQSYIDLLPAVVDDEKDRESTGFEYTTDYMPTFTIAKLDITNNQLSLHFLNGDFIKQQVRSGNMRINHEINDLFNVFMITATTKELRQFLTKYGHDERLFSKENSITLTRKE